MRSISVELSFQIPEDRTTRGEFLIGDGLLKFCVAFVHRRVERSGIEFFARHSKLVDKGEFKIAQAFDRGIASGFGKRCRATTRDENDSGAEENVSRNKHRIVGVRVSRRCADLDQRVKLSGPGSSGSEPGSLV